MLGFHVPSFYGLYSVVLLLTSFAQARQEELALSSCRTVAEVFAKRVPSASVSVPVSPIKEASLEVCSSTLRHTHRASCCDAQAESLFLPASEVYLRQHIRTSNKMLKARITQSLHLYQEHLQRSLHESQNTTSDTLSNLYKIPKNVHRHTIHMLFNQLGSYLAGSDESYLSEIINRFFTNMFPVVFKYVLSNPSMPKHLGEDFDKCLVKHYGEIQPFGNIPKHLSSKFKHGFQRARIYTETLLVMIHTINSTDNLVVHVDCKKAVSRLHFCSMCSGEVDARPCRGLCLNVMRGCLSGVSEISSSWDDLVVDFENLHVGMLKQDNAQELLLYLDGNITDALLHAMDDGPRIFRRVMEVCHDVSHTMIESGVYKKHFTPEGFVPSHPSNRIHSIRKDIVNLIEQLEESKGFLQRLADGLCRTSVIYDQEMQSDRCWNGSTIGRYMREVPEANVITQAKQNMEVKINLIPDQVLRQVKDDLVHMKRNLSLVHNEELMVSDQSYKTVVGSGGGYGPGRDVIIDDEDFAERNSGSGSGVGRDDDDEDDVRRTEDKPMYTPRPGGDSGRGGHIPHGSGGSGGSSRPGDGRDKGSQATPKSSADASILSLTLLYVVVVLISLL